MPEARNNVESTFGGAVMKSDQRKSMEDNYAIRVKDVTKMYKLFRSNRDRLLDALGLTKKQRYQEHYALRNVSFDIARGETVGIIGINGAGKSTILKIITGV